MAAVPQLLAPHKSPALPHFGSFSLRSPLQFIEPRQGILALIFTDGKKLLDDGDQERTGYVFGSFLAHSLVLAPAATAEWHGSTMAFVICARLI